MTYRLAFIRLSAVAVTLVALGTAAVRADDAAKGQAFVTNLFAGPVTNKAGAKTYACFVRHYDADHLAHHPLQKVSAMQLLVTAETIPEADGPTYSFRLGLRYRNRRGAFDSSGDCRHSEITAQTNNEARFDCAVDCDGGGISIGLSKDNTSTLIRLEQIRIWRDNKPDDEASDSLVAGADDKVFRLDRAKPDACASLVTDRKELAAMRRK